jgi:peptide/nickel transport system ATP-binding protein
MTETAPVLVMDNVSKTFGGGKVPVYAARAVSFALTPGRTTALVGESGSGKTTCARLIMREYTPDEGQIVFRGAPLKAKGKADMAAYRSAVQMIFQDPFAALNPAHTIRYHLERPLRIHRKSLSADQRLAEIKALLAQVKLDPDQMLDKYPHELSGGQRQRISIARALAVGPDVIVADEPTSMLDVSVRLGILNLLNEMKRSLDLALLYITHDIATARYVAEDIMVMFAGQIVEWGPVDAVLTNPHHPYTRLLLSAVPDPDIRLGSAPDFDPNEIIAIRKRTAEKSEVVTEVAPGHWIRG